MGAVDAPVCACGKSRRSTGNGYFGRQCSACYQAEYRRRPGRAEAHRAAVIAYAKRNPDKRNRWVRHYRERIGWYNPDLTALRAAIKRLDQAVAAAARRQGIRGAGQHRGDHGPERGD